MNTKLADVGAAPPSVTPVDPGAWGYSGEIFQKGYDALPRPVYDRDKAKALVQQAGSPKHTITIALPAEQRVYLQTAHTLQSTARKVGSSIKTAALRTNVSSNLYYDAKDRAPCDAMAVEECDAGMALPIASVSEFTPVASILNSVVQGPNITGTLASALSRRLRASTRRRAEVPTS
jgi:peptide/nickel transport system substrate-binding protein